MTGDCKSSYIQWTTSVNVPLENAHVHRYACITEVLDPQFSHYKWPPYRVNIPHCIYFFGVQIGESSLNSRVYITLYLLHL